jgi:outer membrane lipoprotein LolB
VILRRRALVIAFGAAALAAGCATTGPRPAPDLAGRLALRVDSADTPRSFSADFDLTGDADRGLLRLTGPLGAVLAEARWQPGRVELSRGAATESYASLDAMAQTLLGEALPLAALLDWLRGRPWPGAASQPEASGFAQLGWRVDLARYGQGLLEATRAASAVQPGVRVLVRLDRSA